VSTADYLGSIVDLGELTAYSNELWEIVILTPDLVIEKDHRTTLELVHSAKEIIQLRARGAVAIVAFTQRSLAWADKIGELLRGRTPVTVFTDEAQARRWLEIHRDNAKQEATTDRYHRPGPHHSQPGAGLH
ncbi:MAG: hypothetical protein KDI19_06060, partial [Pseudomonadales bacterium]|nr:hypothetical protein [Pseudomonadales bacterium]